VKFFQKRKKRQYILKKRRKIHFSLFRFRQKTKKNRKNFIFGNRVNFWKRVFIKLSYFLLFLLFCGLIFVFFFTSFFVIKNIALERDDLRVDTGKVIDSVKDYRYRNILLISPSQIEKQIKKDFSEYKTVQVKRIFPGTLLIKVENFKIIAQAKIYIKPQTKITEFDVETIELKPYEQILGLNSEGIIEKNDETYASLPFLELSGIQDIPLVQGDRLLSKENLELILEAKTLLWEDIGIATTDMKYFPDAKEVHLKTEAGYEIWLDFTTLVATQIDKLKKISNHVDWNENPPEDHIDLRIKNRIIYK